MSLARLVQATLIAAFLTVVTAMSAGVVAQSPSTQKGEDAVAVFAGGCFWCVESDFDHVPGVTKTISGYIGGTVDKPTYEQVSAGGTGHREAVEIHYDPAKVSYDKLLDVFWHSVDPTDDGGQFCDRGFSYTTGIYATSEEQLRLAKKSKAELEKSGALTAPIRTEITSAGTFWPAEDYHQNYYEKNPFQYRFYRWSCGRDARLEELWGEAAMRGIKKE